MPERPEKAKPTRVARAGLAVVESRKCNWLGDNRTTDRTDLGTRRKSGSLR